jgi:YD repeat-containing protein
VRNYQKNNLLFRIKFLPESIRHFIVAGLLILPSVSLADFELLEDIVQYETLELLQSEDYTDPNIGTQIWPFGSSTGVALQDIKAFEDWYAVGQLIWIKGRDPEQDDITLQFIHADGSTTAITWFWDPTDGCWFIDQEFCWDDQFRWGVFMALTKLGVYTFELLINGVVVPAYTKQFEVIGPEFTIVGSNSFSGSIGSTTSLQTRLVDREGIPISNEPVTFVLPLINSPGYGLYPTSDTSDTGSKSRTVNTDSNGMAEVYVKIGNPGATIGVSATTPRMSNTTLTFFLQSLDIEVEGLDHEENLGEQEGRERDPCDSVGNPINVITGNKFQKETDFTGNSASPLEFTRYYNSKDVAGTSFGSNWRHTYERSITFAKEGKGKNAIQYARLKRQDGKGITFIDTGDGYRTDPDHEYDLVKRGGKWELRTPLDGIEVYDGKGKLISMTDIRGNIQSLKHQKGQLQSVTSGSGETIAFFYNDLDQLEQVEYSASNQDPVLGKTRTWTYGYTEGRLTSISNPDGSQREYLYEDATFLNALTGIVDESGNRYATYEYDSNGNATSSYHGFGREQVTIDYGINGERLVTDSLGNLTTYGVFAQLGQGKIANTAGPTCSTGNNAVASYDYDPATNDVLSRTVDGVTTLWSDYDTNGNPWTEIKAANSASEKTTYYKYDPRFRNKLVSITEPSVYSGGDKVTTMQYDDYGNMLSRTVEGYTPSGSPVSQATIYQYNGPYRQMSQIDGPRTDVSDITTFDYYPDDPGLYQHQGMLMRVTGPEGLVLRDNLQYNVFRQLTSESRLNGVTVTYQWQPNTDLLAAMTESVGSASRTTSWTYLPTGVVETITPPDGNTLTFAYDEARRLERIADIEGNYIQYSLDSEGNIKLESTHDSGGTLRRSIARTYDVYNRLDGRFQANESIDYDFDADGTLAREINGRGVETAYSYDELKRLTSTELDVYGNDPSTANSQVGYDYDSQNNLNGVTDPKNSQTNYQYDDLGNVVSLTSPDTGTATYQNDPAGNRIQTTDAKGHVFDFTYDALNRLTSIDAPANDYDQTYVYDSCANGQGMLCTATRGGNQRQYSYNGFGDPVSLTQSVGSFFTSASATIGMSYDAAGRISTINYPGTASVTYSYDALGNVSQVTLNRNGQNTTLLSGMTYELLICI